MLRIKLLRLARGLSQWELGRASGISQGQYSMIERGLIEPTTKERECFAQILGGVPSTLFRPAVRNRKRSEAFKKNAVTT